ncbi:delta endotoxin [Paramuricea clavata]|uniref:Delta endotoxin n=1 Tax=Paramuricea clavata TaxID=317549 RepID=A0A7D9EGK3_PARCT|nr:delta endotoxin [Paramuricea clavata]
MFDSIFAEDVPSYFTEVYKEIERIMHQEITENTINEINGQINGTTEWVKFTYNPRKDSDASKKELYGLLEPKVSDLAINMVAVLEEKTYAESALAVFIIGAGIHLALLQELADVDPNVDDPQQSSYIATIQGYSPEYADHAEKTWETIKKARIAQITKVCIKSQLYPPMAGGPPTDYLYTSEWTDNLTGEKFTDATSFIGGKWTNGNYAELENRANAARTTYINTTIDELQIQMNDPPHAAETWRKLVDQPLAVIE